MRQFILSHVMISYGLVLASGMIVYGELLLYMHISYLVVLGGIFTGVLCDPSHLPRLCYSNVWCVAGIATTEFRVQHVLYTVRACCDRCWSGFGITQANKDIASTIERYIST